MKETPRKRKMSTSSLNEISTDQLRKGIWVRVRGRRYYARPPPLYAKIFELLDYRFFYTAKPPWVGDFGTIIKNVKFYSLSMRSKKFVRAKSEIKVSHGCFWTHFQVSKWFVKILTLTPWVFFSFFFIRKIMAFYRMLSIHKKCFPSCSACVAFFYGHSAWVEHFLAHTKHA